MRDGRVAVHPKELEPRWFGWVDNMHDWCISRQLWWGHRIPVWYGPDGEVVCLGPDEEPPAGWTQDEDVLDTWFSSGLWPFSTLGWPEKTPDLERFYPTSVLVTGYDILFFWVARMMMFGPVRDATAACRPIPFDTIALHGHGPRPARQEDVEVGGQHRRPAGVDGRYGTDALRFALARGANPGTDVPIGEDAVAAARNFGTKLWNATRFALAQRRVARRCRCPRPRRPTPTPGSSAGCREVREQIDALLEDYQFAKATEALYHFTWDEFCAWYLELAKPQLADEATADGTRAVLGPRPRRAAAAAAPGDPVHHRGAVAGAHRSRVGGRRDVAQPTSGAPVDPAAAGADRRTAEADHRDPPVPHRAAGAGQPPCRGPPRRARRGRAGRPPRGASRSLVRLDPRRRRASRPRPRWRSRCRGGTVHVELDTSGAIDVAAERARLGRDLAAAQKELDQADKKLGNPKFVEKAPAEVVEGIRARRATAARPTSSGSRRGSLRCRRREPFRGRATRGRAATSG